MIQFVLGAAVGVAATVLYQQRVKEAAKPQPRVVVVGPTGFWVEYDAEVDKKDEMRLNGTLVTDVAGRHQVRELFNTFTADVQYRFEDLPAEHALCVDSTHALVSVRLPDGWARLFMPRGRLKGKKLGQLVKAELAAAGITTPTDYVEAFDQVALL